MVVEKVHAVSAAKPLSRVGVVEQLLSCRCVVEEVVVEGAKEREDRSVVAVVEEITLVNFLESLVVLAKVFVGILPKQRLPDTNSIRDCSLQAHQRRRDGCYTKETSMVHNNL